MLKYDMNEERVINSDDDLIESKITFNLPYEKRIVYRFKK